MAEPDLQELHRQHTTAQDKYTYFLLAAAASGIAFSVQKTTGLKITCLMVPLGLAALSWGVSFYFGCKKLVWVQASISANYNLLSLLNGVHPDQPNNPQGLEAAKRGVNAALKSNIESADFCARWQFRLLILGAVLFLVWHILEMVIRTYAT